MSDDLLKTISEGSTALAPIEKTEIIPVSTSRKEDVDFAKTAIREIIEIGITDLQASVLEKDSKKGFSTTSLIETLVDAAQILADIEKTETPQGDTENPSQVNNVLITAAPGEIQKMIDGKNV